MQRTRNFKLKGQKLFVADQISCTSSRVYVDKYINFIKDQGCELTSSANEADILLVDTCAFNADHETKSLEMVEENQKRAKVDAKVIVCGCLAGINPQKLQEHYKGPFFSPKNDEHLAYILGVDEESSRFLTELTPQGRFMGSNFQHVEGRPWYVRKAIDASIFLHKVDHKLPLHRVRGLRRVLDMTQPINEKAYAISISQGCLGSCSFCVIPMAKGKTVSLPLGLIVEKIETMVKAGTRKIILTSEDTGAYGNDIGVSFIDLLQHIHRIPGDFHLYINFFDPRWLRKYGEELIQILKLKKIRFLQIPMQSGSNAVLQLMRRAYQTQQVIPFIERIRREAPHVTLTTQIIAGFPGEKEEDFFATQRLIQSNLFHFSEVFAYSHRPGAESTKIKEQLSKEVIQARTRILWKETMLNKIRNMV